jgi:hypothetical protein
MTVRRADARSKARVPRQGASIQTGAGRETDLQRKSGIVAQRVTMLIATNGESTERKYFTALRHEQWVHPRVTVVVERGAPIEVVRGAARRRDQSDFDQAWAVCDVDEYATNEATSAANESGVTLLWSNPCFEIWLLLHHSDCFSFVENAKKAGDRLRAHVKNWDKTALDFALFRDGVDDAVARARKLSPPPDANPSTAVWQLIEALKQRPAT